MKRFYKFICIVLALMTSISLVACTNGNNGGSQENLVINTSVVDLNEGETYQLQSAVQGDYVITYQSSNESVATVTENGKITAVKQGECYITIKAGQSQRTCKVTVVKQIYTVEIAFNNQYVESVNVTEGTTIELYASIYENGEEIAEDVEWQTNGNACDSVKTDKVIRITAKGQGVYTVTAKYKTATKMVTINVITL